MNGQTKWDSFKESFTNILSGYILSLLTQVIVFPLFDINTSMGENMIISLIFTLVSLARLYIIRRIYNWKDNRRN